MLCKYCRKQREEVRVLESASDHLDNQVFLYNHSLTLLEPCCKPCTSIELISQVTVRYHINGLYSWL